MFLLNKLANKLIYVFLSFETLTQRVYCGDLLSHWISYLIGSISYSQKNSYPWVWRGTANSSVPWSDKTKKIIIICSPKDTNTWFAVPNKTCVTFSSQRCCRAAHHFLIRWETYSHPAIRICAQLKLHICPDATITQKVVTRLCIAPRLPVPECR